MRESKESPRLKAFCRVAPSVLFNDRAIFPAGVFFRASAFNVRTCSDVHALRFPFRLAIISPSGQSRSLVAARNKKEKINFGIISRLASSAYSARRNARRRAAEVPGGSRFRLDYLQLEKRWLELAKERPDPTTEAYARRDRPQAAFLWRWTFQRRRGLGSALRTFAIV